MGDTLLQPIPPLASCTKEGDFDCKIATMTLSSSKLDNRGSKRAAGEAATMIAKTEHVSTNGATDNINKSSTTKDEFGNAVKTMTPTLIEQPVAAPCAAPNTATYSVSQSQYTAKKQERNMKRIQDFKEGDLIALSDERGFYSLVRISNVSKLRLSSKNRLKMYEVSFGGCISGDYDGMMSAADEIGCASDWFERFHIADMTIEASEMHASGQVIKQIID